MGETHPPSGSGFIDVFLLGYFYLLDPEVDVYCAFFIIKHNITHVNPEWCIDVLWVSAGSVDAMYRVLQCLEI